MNGYKKGADILVRTCAGLKRNEKALIIANKETLDVARHIYDSASKITGRVCLKLIKAAGMHGQEPPAAIKNLMKESDVIFCLTKYSLAHSSARVDASKRGARFLSLPDYSLGLLKNKSLGADYDKQQAIGYKINRILRTARAVHVSTPAGTDLVLTIEGRSPNCHSGLCLRRGDMSSPPDIEVNIAPVEKRSCGRIVVDGSVCYKGIGRLSSPLMATIEQGSITHMQGRHCGKIGKLFDANGPRSSVLAEFGIGLNPKAKISGVMLQDEGAIGTIHLGFGSNTSIGGKNRVPFHLDFVIRRPDVKVDDKVIMRRGRIII